MPRKKKEVTSPVVKKEVNIVEEAQTWREILKRCMAVKTLKCKVYSVKYWKNLAQTNLIT